MTSDSRWGTTSTSTAGFGGNERVHKIENDRHLSDIITALSGLPIINQGNLQHHADLGQGSYGIVTLEHYDPRTTDPYLVAVKYTATQGRSPEELHRAYRAVKREIRVFAHPPFKNHVSILQAIGYGTASRVGYAADPYLVLEYCEFGTLCKYLGTRVVPQRECLELALDIATGLEVLHRNKILHGDVKPSNILIINADYHTSPVRRVAKISDFGCTVTEEETIRFGHRPYGTLAYLAPELDVDNENDFKPNNRTDRDDRAKLFDLLCRTDVYSFGLLLWELFRIREATAGNNAGNSIDIELRRSLHNQRKDALVQRATKWVTENLLNHYNSTTDAHLNERFSAIDSTLKLCLRDSAHDRASASLVVQSLTVASGENRALRMYSPSRAEGLSSSDGSYQAFNASNVANMALPDAKPHTASLRFLPNRLRPNDPDAGFETEDQKLIFNESHILLQDLPPPNTPAEQITTLVHTRRPYTEVVPQLVSDRTVDIFQVGHLELPIWNEQVRIRESFDAIVEAGGDADRIGNAQLQLAACCFIGFGITANNIEGSYCLHDAAKTNFIASVLQARAWSALSVGERHLHPPMPPDVAHGISMKDAKGEPIDFATTVWKYQQLAGRQIVEAVQRRMDVYTARDHVFSTANHADAEFLRDRFMQQLFSTRHISRMIAAKTYSPRKTSLALTLAYQWGLSTVAESLSRSLTTFIPVEGHPTPLHWLISFEPSIATLLADILVKGADRSKPINGICHSLLNSVVQEPFRLPEHAMELFGTPLHWAVRVGSLPLVKTLVSLGANVNTRCFPQRTELKNPSSGHVPFQSPLDVAAMFHFPDLVEYLIQEGAHVCGGDGYEHHTALHMVGQVSHPLARMVIHRGWYLQKVRDTIQSFQHWGLDINTFAKPYAAVSYTPLRWALQSLRSEEYIVGSLLALGATEPRELQPRDVPLSIFATNAEAHRPGAAWKLKAIIHLVKDVNERSGDWEYDRNALHICIENDNTEMAAILASTGCLDLEARVLESRYTPLNYAVLLGRIEMTRWLLNKGSSVKPKDNDAAPLQVAVRLRHLDVAVLLLGWGASTTFGPVDPVKNLPNGSILHQAVMSTHKGLRRSSFMRTLLSRLPNLKTPIILNQRWSADKGTALHLAAVRGDFDAVQALLEAGADSTITTTNDPSMRASMGCTTSGDPLEITTKYIFRYDRDGPDYNEQPWLKGHNRDSAEAKNYRQSLEEIRVLLSLAKPKGNIE